MSLPYPCGATFTEIHDPAGAIPGGGLSEGPAGAFMITSGTACTVSAPGLTIVPGAGKFWRPLREIGARILLNDPSRDGNCCNFFIETSCADVEPNYGKGIASMKAHKWIPPVSVQARGRPAYAPAAATRPSPLRRAARGIAVLALALAGIAAEGAIMSSHVTSDNASARQAAASNRLVASALPATGHAVSNPWMY
jgi:hypothetical protein